ASLFSILLSAGYSANFVCGSAYLLGACLSYVSCFYFSLVVPPPGSTLFPYTTLFRSCLSPPGVTSGRIAGRLRRRSTAHVPVRRDRKSTRLNSSHVSISYAVFCLKKKKSTSPPSTISFQHRFVVKRPSTRCSTA